MCWNAPISIISFLVVLGVSYGLYQRNLYNDRLLAIFIISYGTMQLFETFMWFGQKDEWKILNIIGSVLACLLLYLHPLAIMIGIKIDNLYKSVLDTLQYKVLFIISCGFLLFGLCKTIYNLFYKIGGQNKFLSYPDKRTGHLIWRFEHNYKYSILLSIIIAILIIMPLNNLLFTLTLFIYYLLPYYLIIVEGGNNLKDVLKLSSESSKIKNNDLYYGSFWCWIVAFFSFIMYIMNPYLQPISKI